jgi:hypothetical protein
LSANFSRRFGRRLSVFFADVFRGRLFCRRLTADLAAVLPPFSTAVIFVSLDCKNNTRPFSGAAVFIDIWPPFNIRLFDPEQNSMFFGSRSGLFSRKVDQIRIFIVSSLPFAS